MTHQIQKQSQVNKSLREFVFSLVLHLAANERNLNKVGEYFGYENFGTNLTICLQKLEKVLKDYDDATYPFSINDFFNSIKEIFGNFIGNIVSY